VARRHRRVGLGEHRSFGLRYRRPEERLVGDGAAQRRVSGRTGVARHPFTVLALRGVEHWSGAEEKSRRRRTASVRFVIPGVLDAPIFETLRKSDISERRRVARPYLWATKKDCCAGRIPQAALDLPGA
jgi:hypothetical protein